jgi:hypothetical protein
MIIKLNYYWKELLINLHNLLDVFNFLIKFCCIKLVIALIFNLLIEFGCISVIGKYMLHLTLTKLYHSSNWLGNLLRILNLFLDMMISCYICRKLHKNCWKFIPTIRISYKNLNNCILDSRKDISILTYALN